VTDQTPIAAPKTGNAKINGALLAVVLVGFAVAYGLSWYTVLRATNAIEYEGPMFWAANALAHGQNIYDPAKLISAPFQVITYPPVFMIFAAVLMKVFGPSYWCLRAVTIAAAIVSAFYLYRLLRLSGCAPWLAAIAPAYFMGFSPTFVWNNCGRPDCVATAFCLAGLERLYSAFQKHEEGKKWMPSGVMAGILLALSCLSKQTAVVCAVSGLLFLIWNKRFKLAAIIGAVIGGLGLLLSGIAQLITGGFAQNMMYFGQVRWQQDLLVQHLHFMSDGDIQRTELLFAVLLYCVIVRKQTTTVAERLPYVLFGISFLNAMYMLGLPDSNGNHAIFFFLAMSWWLALKCSTLPIAASRIVLLGSLLGLPFLANYFPAALAELPRTNDVLGRAVGLADKSVLSEDPYLNFLSASRPAMIDCAVFEAAWEARQPERLKALEAAVARQEFAALIVNCTDLEGKSREIWPPDTVKVFKEHYKSSGNLSGNGICQQLMLPK